MPVFWAPDWFTKNWDQSWAMLQLQDLRMPGSRPVPLKRQVVTNNDEDKS